MEINNPLISIIIPSYNCESLIAETLNSVIDQTYKNWEVVIVDDGSTDMSLEVIEEFCNKDNRIKLFSRNREPKGGSVCRNIGIEKSNGEYLLFLDSDDLLAKFCLEQRITIIHSQNRLDFVAFNTKIFFNKPGDSEKYAVSIRSDDPIADFIKNRYPYPWHTSGPIWRASFVQLFGGFSENYPRLQDPEFHLRALLSKDIRYKVEKDMPADSYYRVVSKSLSLSMSLKFLSGLTLFLTDTYPLVVQFDKDHQTSYKRYYSQAIYNSLYSTMMTKDVFTPFVNLLHLARQLKIINTADLINMKTYFLFRLGAFKLLRPFWVKIKSSINAPA